MRRLSVQVALLAAALLLCLPAPAQALPFMSEPRQPDYSSDILRLSEILIPDVRLEIGGRHGGMAALFTMPLSFLLTRGNLHDKLYITGNLEPQYQLRDNVWRGVSTARADYGPLITTPGSLFGRYGWLSVYMEAGGVVGQDGSGGTIGAGVSLLAYHPIHALTLGGRATYTVFHGQGAWRYDIVLDVADLPFLLVQPRSWAFPNTAQLPQTR